MPFRTTEPITNVVMKRISVLQFYERILITKYIVTFLMLKMNHQPSAKCCDRHSLFLYVARHYQIVIWTVA